MSVDKKRTLLDDLRLCTGVLLLCAGPALGQDIGFASVQLEVGGIGHGAAIADFDQDGWDDVLIAMENGASVLLRNNAEPGSTPTFTDVTDAAGIRTPGTAVNPIWADVNNDGYPDLFIGIRSGNAPNALYLNNGDGTFTNVSENVGLNLQDRVGAAAFGDFDNDGGIDLFIATREGPDRLYRHTGAGPPWFEDVSGRAGIGGHDASIAMQATWVDVDRDGDQDLFAVHDGTLPNRFYLNEGFLPLRELARPMGIDDVGSGNGMGIAWGDPNGDGLPDAYVTRIGTGSLYQNLGPFGPGAPPAFSDVAASVGAVRNGMSWGVVFADFDQDADEDLFIVNTYSFDRTPAFLYENTGEDAPFANVSDIAKANVTLDAFGTVRGDFNNDGYPDLLIVNQDGPHELLINTRSRPGNWLKVHLEGTGFNRMALGATVRVVTGDNVQYRTVSGGDSFCSQSSPTLHIGLGTQATVDTLDVQWGTAPPQQFVSLPGNTTYRITEGQEAVPVALEAEPPATHHATLEQPYPNPAHGQTTIDLTLPTPQPLTVALYDALGRRVRTLKDGWLGAGRHALTLETRTLPPGLYLYHLRTEQAVQTRRLVILPNR